MVTARKACRDGADQYALCKQRAVVNNNVRVSLLYYYIWRGIGPGAQGLRLRSLACLRLGLPCSGAWPAARRMSCSGKHTLRREA